jgi:hypothetical protein
MANLHSSLQVDNGYYILLQVGSILLFLIHAGHAIGVLSSRIMVGYPHPTVFFMSSRLVASHSLESHPCDPAGAWASFWGDAQVRQLVNYPFFDRNDGKVMGSQT